MVDERIGGAVGGSAAQEAVRRRQRSSEGCVEAAYYIHK